MCVSSTMIFFPCCRISPSTDRCFHIVIEIFITYIHIDISLYNSVIRYKDLHIYLSIYILCRLVIKIFIYIYIYIYLYLYLSISLYLHISISSYMYISISLYSIQDFLSLYLLFFQGS